MIIAEAKGYRLWADPDKQNFYRILSPSGKVEARGKRRDILREIRYWMRELNRISEVMQEMETSFVEILKNEPYLDGDRRLGDLLCSYRDELQEAITKGTLGELLKDVVKNVIKITDDKGNICGVEAFMSFTAPTTWIDTVDSCLYATHGDRYCSLRIERDIATAVANYYVR